MPNFWGCRCCKRVVLVLASDGKINFVSGRGTDLGQITDSSIISSGEVHWLKKNRWVWANRIAGTAPCVFRGDRSSITDSTNGWFSLSGATTNGFLKNSLIIGTDGQHAGIPNINKVGPDEPSKIFDVDGTFVADCNYDNGSGSDPSETYGIYLAGKYCINTVDASSTWDNLFSVFNPDGSLDDSWSLNSATGTTGSFDGALYPLPLNDGFVVLHDHASSPTSRMTKLDITGSVLWSVALPSGLSVHQLPHYQYPTFLNLANGNFLICPISQTPVHLVDGSNGSVLDSFDIPTSSTLFSSMCADPYDPNYIYVFTFGDVVHNVGQYLEKVKLSDQTVAWSTGFDGYNVYSMDSIGL